MCPFFYLKNVNRRKQAGAELCQSRVMLDVIVEVVVKVGIEAVIKIGIQLLLRLGGWVNGWLENWRVMLISTKIVVKVAVEVEMCNNKNIIPKAVFICQQKLVNGLIK